VKILTVKEGSSAKYRATIKDDDGVVIPAAQITSLKLTYYVAEGSDSEAGEIINNRNEESVLNNNKGVTVDSSGRLVWSMVPAETRIKVPARMTELHYARWDWEYGTGSVGRHQVGFRVTNLRRTT
jgi:hypothetical protein